MKFNINKYPISYIEVSDDLSTLAVVVGCLPTKTPAWFDRSEYNGFRNVSEREFFDTRDSVEKVMKFPNEYQQFRCPVVTNGPIIELKDATNLSEKLRKDGPKHASYGCQQLIDQGFVSANQYPLQKLLESGFIHATQHTEINEYFESRFVDIYAATETVANRR